MKTYSFSCPECSGKLEATEDKIMDEFCCDFCGYFFIPAAVKDLFISQTKKIATIPPPPEAKKPLARKKSIDMSTKVSSIDTSKNEVVPALKAESNFALLSSIHWGVFLFFVFIIYCLTLSGKPSEIIPTQLFLTIMLFILFLFIYTVPFVAHTRGRNCWLWWGFCLLQTPIPLLFIYNTHPNIFNFLVSSLFLTVIGSIYYMLVTPKLKICNMCVSRIDYRAKICKFCSKEQYI